MARTDDPRRREGRRSATRRRITEAAAALHGEVGPARTTITAIAARAGVERLTVYRHFPDARALFGACSAHWRAQHPPPDPAAWRSVRPPAARVRAALVALYGYYGANAAMLAHLVRDAPLLPALAEVFGLPPYLAAVRETLLADWPAPPARPAALRPAIGHALQFATWQSLTQEHGLTDAAAAALMADFVICIAQHDQARPAASE
jgi:AcrR family transcriptional regulator